MLTTVPTGHYVLAMTSTYRTAGTTDEITTCDACGRVELAGTVRLEIVTADGVVEGETYAGTSCAAKLAGRPAAAIRREAREADKSARDAAYAAASRAADAFDVLVGQWLAMNGLDRTFETYKLARTAVRAELAA